MSSEDFSLSPKGPLPENAGASAFPLPIVRRADRYWFHFLLFGLTLLTMTLAGACMQYDFDRNAPFDLERIYTQYIVFWHRPSELLTGLPFALTLMAILLAHELGHFLAASYHRVDASLPYFLPSPSLLGTFGAFIKVRSPIYSKGVLFDIGAAGPLAGFVFLLPALAVGLAFSKVIPDIGNQGMAQFGSPGLQWIMERLIFPGVPSSDIYLHPVARAAWVGMLATALNLLPIGQLDGGHILYSFFPRQHKTISKVVCLLLLPLAWFWFWWLFWAALLFWLGRRHPAIYDDTDLTPGRRKLGWAALAVFILCFTYAPITAGGL